MGDFRNCSHLRSHLYYNCSTVYVSQHDLLFVLAAIKANLKKVDEAIELLEKSIKVGPENNEATELLNHLKSKPDKS
jgi:hypothetical protein